MGIIGMGMGRDDNDFMQELNTCSTEVCFLAISMYAYISQLRDVLPRLLMREKNLNVKVLLSKPDTIFLNEKEREEDCPTVDRIKNEVISSVGMLQRIYNDAKRNGYTGQFEVKLYEGMTYCTLYIFDDRLSWYNPYVRKTPGKSLMVFKVLNQKDSIFKNLSAHFKAVWDDPTNEIKI
jgi:hypothetical protein